MQVDIRKTFLYRWEREEGLKKGKEIGIEKGKQGGLKKAILLE
jgi:predicted transposase YdaD